jgi:hypothetical protein
MELRFETAQSCDRLQHLWSGANRPETMRCARDERGSPRRQPRWRAMIY